VCLIDRCLREGAEVDSMDGDGGNEAVEERGLVVVCLVEGGREDGSWKRDDGFYSSIRQAILRNKLITRMEL
jgi:hypothetical protein